jgi:hypothetical protein
MIQTVDIFKQIAANLTANVVIDDAIDNLDGTFTLETTNTQWVSEFEIYSIGGFDYKIDSLIQNISLTISPVSNGTLPTAPGFVIPAPTFINGTLKMAQNEVTAIKNKMNLVPFIYLYEVIRDRKNTDDESTVERECDLRFFFINSSSFKDMLTEDVYEKVIYPLHPLVELFIAKIKASPLFTDILNYDEINLINFSEEGNQNKSIFDLNLSAIELRLQAEIRSVNCDDVYTNPNPTCLPVRITDENVVVEVAAGMAYTCANSEPCEPIRVTFDNNLIAETSTDLNIDCSTVLDVAIITNNATFNGTYTANGTQNGQTKYVNTVNSNLVIIGGAAWQVKNLVGTTINQDPPPGQDYPWLADWGGQLTMVQATIENYCGGGTAPDGEFYINLVKVADVPSGGNASAFVTLDGVNAGTYNSINNTWEVVSNPCSDATYTIKDRDETTLYSGSIVSGGNLNQYIENTTVEVNDTSFADVVAQGYLNVQVLNTEATQLGSKVGNNWEIPDTTYNIYVNGVLDQSFSVPTLKAETINITP